MVLILLSMRRVFHFCQQDVIEIRVEKLVLLDEKTSHSRNVYKSSNHIYKFGKSYES